MKETIYKEILFLVFGGIIGAFLKHWWDYRGMVHKELWQKRYEKYQGIFALTGKFPLYPQRATITYQELLKMSADMRDWFFSEGGILLSTKTRNKYFKVQKKSKEIVESKGTKLMDQKIDEEEYESIRHLLSRLRKAMTDDLMSRNRMAFS